MWGFGFLIVFASLLVPTAAAAHGGGLNECGCHVNRKTGECHCHRPGSCGCACKPTDCGIQPNDDAPNKAPLAARCGTERWGVKTLTDPDAERVQIDSPIIGTIEELRTLARAYSDTNIRTPAEEAVYSVEGIVVAYKRENDADLHVVIRNDIGEEMIVEFPHPRCLQGSRVLEEARSARTKFLGFVPPFRTARVQRPLKPIRVRVTGVLFFDRNHGQIGVAPNGVELHPVIGIEKVAQR
jgi:hypothetical protein